jgi:4-hydroxy-tetrahydrodipicolinate synthase
MPEPLFVGAGVALVTPFDAGGVNEEVLRQLVRFQLRGGIDALVVNGSTGEAAAMSADEQQRAAEVVVQEAAGRVPVVGGAGGSDTREVIDLARRAHEAGVDALLISGPVYNKPPQRGVLAHFRAVLDAVPLPLIVYNIPGRTCCNILPETIEELAGDPRVIGVKEASGDISQVTELARRVGDRVPLYSGNDDQVLPLLALGGHGVVSVLANVAPGEVSHMVHAFLTGDLDAARRIQLDFLPLIHALFAESSPIPVKTAVAALGFDVGGLRLPLVAPSPEVECALLERMRERGLAVRERR